MTNYVAYFEPFGGGKETAAEFEAFGNADANVKARRYATENVVVLKGVYDADAAAGPLPVAA